MVDNTRNQNNHFSQNDVEDIISDINELDIRVHGENLTPEQINQRVNLLRERTRNTLSNQISSPEATHLLENQTTNNRNELQQ